MAKNIDGHILLTREEYIDFRNNILNPSIETIDRRDRCFERIAKTSKPRRTAYGFVATLVPRSEDM